MRQTRPLVNEEGKCVNEQGERICGSKLKNNRGYCESSFVLEPIGHCRMHAGKNPVGVAKVAYKHGKRSKYLKIIPQRLADCGLEVHPQKTRVVYCKDSMRRGTYPEQHFDFLGFTFRPRKSKDRFGRYFTNFTPAVSSQAAKKMRHTMRRWALPRRSDKMLADLARMFNPVLRGWLTYYGSYSRSALHPTCRCLDEHLSRWAKRKYKRLRGHHRRARHWLRRIARTQPELFAHWRYFQSMAGQ
jgi:RNA-directed DNA polymerase